MRCTRSFFTAEKNDSAKVFSEHRGLTRFDGHLILEVLLPRKDVCDAKGEAAGVSASALELVQMGEPVAQVAQGLGISEGTPRLWMAIDAVDSGRVEGLTSAEKRELFEVRLKTRVLEMENEILKRASAYFARENILPK